MTDILLLVNVVIGFFAAAANGYHVLLARQMPRRIVFLVIALLCLMIAVVNAGIVLGVVPAGVFGALLLRPLSTALLSVLFLSPFIETRYSDSSLLESRLRTLESAFQKQTKKVGDLEQTIRILLLKVVNKLEKDKPASLPSVLVVIGDIEGLDIKGELQGIQDSGLEYTIMDAPVKRGDLVAELVRSDPDELYIIAHMSEDGIALGDGVVGMGWWRQVVRNNKVPMVFANGCKSLKGVVDALFDDGALFVLGMRDDIGNKAATIFATQYHHWLAAGYSASSAAKTALLSLDPKDAVKIARRGDWP